VPGQSERISAKRIGFNDLSTGLQVFVVDASDQFRLGKIQFVVRPVDEDSLGVQQSAHRPVTQNGRLFDPGEKIGSHDS